MTTMSTPASISASERSKPASPTDGRRRDPQPAELVLAGGRVQHRLFGVLEGEQPGAACPCRRSPAASRSGAAASGCLASSQIGGLVQHREVVARSSSRCTGVSSAVAKRMSRLVTMPTTRPALVDHREAGEIVALDQRLGVGERLVGVQRDRVVDDARSRSASPGAPRAPAPRCRGCLWITPMPPAWAMAIAIRPRSRCPSPPPAAGCSS